MAGAPCPEPRHSASSLHKVKNSAPCGHAVATDKSRSGHTQQKGNKPATDTPMTVSAKNFGPITSGTIKLRPLTILIGPSNSGKSYIAKLSYCISRSLLELKSGFNMRMDYFLPSGDIAAMADPYESALSDMRILVKKLPQNRDIAIPTSTVLNIYNAMMSPFSGTLAKELRREFRGDLSRLVRFSAVGFSIDISGKLQAHLGWPSNTGAKPKAVHLTRHWVALDPHLGTVLLKTELDGKTKVDPLPTPADHFAASSSKELEDSTAHNLVHMVMGKLRATVFPSDDRAFFFSLSRPPLMNMLDASHDRDENDEHFPNAALDNILLPGLPRGFVQFILSIDVNMPGPLSELADAMERDLLGGNVSLTKLLSAGLPTITFETPSGNVPLRLVSSHVSSMALLTIYLKYLILPGHRIIIEEPEAHMHPANQLKFAKYVALLIRRGVNVTLVTHSVLIVERLSACLMLGSLDAKSRKKAVSEPDAYLTPNEVSAHEFIATSSGNCTIKDLDCSKYDGIDQEEFGKMRFNMYNERLSLRQQIEAYMNDSEPEKA